ncbi:RIP metalloprotease RseP [Rickettsia endosymbiont of Halotydeus destructor]|uniref:RIP metalloprotease RseP n=1 Tax=Rickettsia endosymbiont of Halotydeus destructor TaxID=2996754 RepID=UPI003BAE4808
MLSIFGFILTISILVFIHELGHYLAARFFGVKVEEFSIGFGKELIGITDKRGVRWKICLLPLGGYVKIYGYDQSLLDKTKAINNEVAFFAKSCLARFLIVAAGPMINYLLAIIIFTGFYFCIGKIEIPAVIAEIVTSSPAEKAGLQENDKIIKINNKIVKDFSDVQNEILINQNRPANLLIQRKEEELNISITPEEISSSSKQSSKIKRFYLGIMAKGEPIHIKINIFSSIVEATSDTIDFSILTLKAFAQMILGQRSLNEIGGPVKIAKESGKSLAQGADAFLWFMAMLSINLGLLNLLPIPVLDGGHLIFITYEAITGKLPNNRIKNILLQLGAGIIIFLIIVSISNDIKGLFS